MFRRLGSPIPQYDGTLAPSVLITQMSDQVPGLDAYLVTPRLLNGVNLAFVAQDPIRGAPFSPTTLTAAVKDATGTRLKLNGNLPAGTQKGDIVLNTTRGSRAMVSAVAGGNATITQPLMDPFLTTVTAFVGNFTEDNGWTAGNTYEIHRPLTSNMQAILPQGGTLDVTSTRGSLWVQGMHFLPISANSSFAIRPDGPNLYLSQCWTESSVSAEAVTGNVFALLSCLATGPLFLANFSTMIAGESTNLLQLDGATNFVDGDVAAADLTIGSGNSDIENVGVSGVMQSFGKAVLVLSPSTGTCRLWGSGTLNPRNGGDVQNISGTTFVSCLKIATLQMDGIGTGTKYVAGTFTDGVAITAANLDTFSGLQNPLTGSRYAIGA